MKTIIIYYSQARGNTKRIAQMIADKTGAPLLQIDTKVPYTGSYDDIVEQGKKEVSKGYKPELKPINTDLSAYDTFIIGTPTWWYTMAPAILTFLTSQDLSGKTVIPFATHGGWSGHVLKDMKNACKGADVKCPKDIQFDSEGGSKLITPESEINEWTLSLPIH